MGGFIVYAVEIGMTDLRRLIKIGTGVHAILRFGRSSLNGCNVGITDGRDL
jgi:hypothetical protein